MSKLTEQQLAAVVSVDAHVLVPAGAGSGKTHVLVERFLEVLKRHPELAVGNVVAVTYTKKAANEMRTRLKAALEALVTDSTGQARERWQGCLADIDAARIGTIHSLCESILKSFPVEAQIDPQFEVLGDLELVEYLRQSIEQALLEVVQENGDEVELLSKYPVEYVRQWLEKGIKDAPQLQEALNCWPELNEEVFLSHYRALLRDWQAEAVGELTGNHDWSSCLTFLRNNPPQGRTSSFQDMVQAALHQASVADECCRQISTVRDGRQLVAAGVQKDVAGNISGDEPIAEAVKALREMVAVINLRLGGTQEDVKAIRDALRALRDPAKKLLKELPDDLGDEDRIAFADIRRLLAMQKRVWEIYTRMKKSQQRLDFNDLIQAADELLSKENSLARRYYHESIAAILVDEFQDTNGTQSQLIANLAGPDTRLFLIGDDKQSIYKFQGADVSIFNNWRLHFENAAAPERKAPLPGNAQVLILNRSFRSHPSIVDFVNQLFDRLLSDSRRKSYRAVYQPLESDRSRQAPEKRIEAIRYDFSNEEGKKSEDADILEAQAVVNWIRQKVKDGTEIFDKHGQGQRPVSWGDFAVLARRNHDFQPFEQVLSAAGIPYVLMGGSGFLLKQEVYDLENMLRFLSSPSDSQSLLGVLRSPLLGISDDLLHQLSITAQRGSLWQHLQVAASQNGADEILPQTVRILQDLLLSAGRKPLPELLREIIQRTNYDALLILQTGGRQRGRNVWKLVQLAHENAQMSLSEFVQSLQSMREFRVKQTAAPLDSENAVKLMTIHSSKGLEFPIVALPKLDTKAFEFKGKLHFHREYGLSFDSTRGEKEEKPAHFLVAKRIETDMEIAESKRLLYVAMTRARDYLGLFFDEREESSESFKTWIQEFFREHPADTSATCLELRTDRQTIFNPALISEAAVDAGKAQIQPAINLDLITDLSAANIPPRPRWQSLLRVTPSASLPEIEPTVLGDCFHKVMEYFCESLRLPDADTLKAVLESDGIAVVHPQLSQLLLTELKRLLQLFDGSDLQALMQDSKLRLAETPYVLLTEDSPVVSKRPDLLLQDCLEQWHVIDYKTDHIAEAEMAHQAEEHRKQLSTYRHDIELLAGVKPAAAVYFAQLGRLHRL